MASIFLLYPKAFTNLHHQRFNIVELIRANYPPNLADLQLLKLGKGLQES